MLWSLENFRLENFGSFTNKVFLNLASNFSLWKVPHSLSLSVFHIAGPWRALFDTWEMEKIDSIVLSNFQLGSFEPTGQGVNRTITQLLVLISEHACTSVLVICGAFSSTFFDTSSMLDRISSAIFGIFSISRSISVVTGSGIRKLVRVKVRLFLRVRF